MAQNKKILTFFKKEQFPLDHRLIIGYIIHIASNKTKSEEKMEYCTEVTNVRVMPVENTEGKLRAMVRITLNEHIVLTNMRLYEGAKGLFVAYPIEQTSKEDEFRQVFYPIRRSLREHVEEKVIQQYTRAIKHDC